MLVQTLSDNNQIKLDKNEQQIEQVNFFLCVFLFYKILFFSIEQKLNHIGDN
jgi:hypothetical protein